jgi:uncharacterized protein YjbI with pentapeptide repeats
MERQREFEERRARDEKIEAARRAEMLATRRTTPMNYSPLETLERFDSAYGRGQRFFAASVLPRQSFAGRSLAGANFSNANLVGADFRGANLTEADFTGADLSEVRFDSSTVLSETIFDTCKLRQLQFGGARFADCSFKGADLTGATVEMGGEDGSSEKLEAPSAQEEAGDLDDWSGPREALFAMNDAPRAASFWDCSFESAMLVELCARKVIFCNCNFQSAKLSSSALSDSWFHECVLIDADLSGANLAGARVPESQFKGSTIKAATGLPSLHWTLGNFGGCDLSGLNLSKCKLRRVNARQADFSGTDLSEALLAESKFSDARFKGANLSGSRWGDAEVSRADFEASDLRRVVGLEFDDNNVANARLSPRGSDTWSVLRRNYSGTRFLFHLLLLVGFFGPLLLEATSWGHVNSLQSSQQYARLIQSVADRMEGVDASVVSRM